MKENLIIELSSGTKYVVIDLLEYQKEKYFLLSELGTDGEALSSDFYIVLYDEKNNNFDKIEDQEMFKYMKKMFDEHLEYKKTEDEILEHINLNNLVEVIIEDINGYDYVLRYEDNILKKNIEFMIKTKIEIGDRLLLSQDTLKEDMLTFGHIKNINLVNDTNILIIKRATKRIYLERYYG